MTVARTTSRRPRVFEKSSASSMICMTVAMMLLPVGDTIAKILTGYRSAIEMTTIRLLTQGLCLCVLTRANLGQSRHYAPKAGQNTPHQAALLACLRGAWAFQNSRIKLPSKAPIVGNFKIWHSFRRHRYEVSAERHNERPR